MIKQIIHSEKELRKLLKEEILSNSSKMFTISKNEIDEHMIDLMRELPKNYPVFMFIELTFVFKGFHIDLVSSWLAMDKDELLKYHNELEECQKN